MGEVLRGPPKSFFLSPMFHEQKTCLGREMHTIPSTISWVFRLFFVVSLWVLYTRSWLRVEAAYDHGTCISTSQEEIKRTEFSVVLDVYEINNKGNSTWQHTRAHAPVSRFVTHGITWTSPSLYSQEQSAEQGLDGPDVLSQGRGYGMLPINRKITSNTNTTTTNTNTNTNTSTNTNNKLYVKEPSS